LFWERGKSRSKLKRGNYAGGLSGGATAKSDKEGKNKPITESKKSLICEGRRKPKTIPHHPEKRGGKKKQRGKKKGGRVQTGFEGGCLAAQKGGNRHGEKCSQRMGWFKWDVHD